MIVVQSGLMLSGQTIPPPVNAPGSVLIYIFNSMARDASSYSYAILAIEPIDNGLGGVQNNTTYEGGNVETQGHVSYLVISASPQEAASILTGQIGTGNSIPKPAGVFTQYTSIVSVASIVSSDALKFVKCSLSNPVALGNTDCFVEVYGINKLDETVYGTANFLIIAT